jgi:hypothetical protein
MQTRTRDAGTTLFLAVVGGTATFLVVAVGSDHVFLEAIQDYDRSLVTLGLVAAGAGWLLGAAAGLAWTSAAPPRSAARAWLMRGLAVLFLLGAWTVPTWSQVLPNEIGLGYHVTAREPLVRTIWLEAILAAITCLALGQTRFRRGVLIAGALLAVGIVVASVALLASDPCPLEPCDEVFGLR